jgi:ABC-type nitrate/sulfonate/bicarbonate transport system substrate-binding protein
MNLRAWKLAAAVGMAGTAMLAALTACGHGAEAGDSESVEYGGQSIVPDLVFRGKDWSEPYDVGIKQVKFPSGGEAFEALLSGEVEVSNGGSGRLITIAAQRPDAVAIVAKWQYGGDRYSLLVPPGSNLATASDLKGKTVAVDTGSGAFTLFQSWLTQNGLAPNDVRIIESKVSDVGSTVQAGSADVGIAWEPTASLLVHNGLLERFMTLKEAGQSPNFLIVNRKWAEGHRDQLVGFLRAALDVGNFVIDDPDAAGEMASNVSHREGVEAPAEALAESLRHVEMAPEVDDASLEELASLAQEMLDQKLIPAVPDFKAMVDPSYLDEAMDK